MRSFLVPPETGHLNDTKSNPASSHPQIHILKRSLTKYSKKHYRALPLFFTSLF